MTSERTQAYGRVMRTLQDVGAAKLHESERERIREAADTLVLAATAGEAAAALDDASELCDQLVSNGRWSAERASGLNHDLLACGPLEPGVRAG